MNDTQARALFRRRINEQVRRVHMKKETLSKLTGASVSQVNRWMEGNLMPTYRQFQRVLEIFGIEDSYVLGNSTSENSYTRRFEQV